MKTGAIIFMSKTSLIFMNHKFVRAGLVLPFCILFGAGCQRAAPTVSAPVAPPPPAVASASACDHPYYPLKPGYEVEYRSNYNGNAGGYTVSVDTGTAADNVKLKLRFNQGTTSDQIISCDGGNLKAMGYVDIASAVESRQVDVETKNVEGYLLPGDMHVGSDWTAAFDVVMKMNIPEMQRAGLGTVEGSIKFHRKVVGQESVTVPAGTFDALKVESETTIDTHAPGRPGGPTATVPSIKTVEWWVKGKGMVKSVTPSAGLGGNITVEATRIVVP